MSERKVKLQSNDGETFDVDIEIAKQSTTIKTMLEGKGLVFALVIFILEFIDLGIDDDDVIPLPNVNSAILKRVKLKQAYILSQQFFYCRYFALLSKLPELLTCY